MSGDFTITGLGNADTDNLVEPGEIYEVTVPNLNTGLTTADLSTSTIFTVEVIPPQGAVLHIERTTPVYLETINDLG